MLCLPPLFLALCSVSWGPAEPARRLRTGHVSRGDGESRHIGTDAEKDTTHVNETKAIVPAGVIFTLLPPCWPRFGCQISLRYTRTSSTLLCHSMCSCRRLAEQVMSRQLTVAVCLLRFPGRHWQASLARWWMQAGCFHSVLLLLHAYKHLVFEAPVQDVCPIYIHLENYNYVSILQRDYLVGIVGWTNLQAGELSRSTHQLSPTYCL